MGSEVFGLQRANFELVGELVGKRIVTSPKQPDWKLFVWKVAAKGSTLEVQVEESDYERGIVEGAYTIAGAVVVEANRTKLVARKIAPMPITKASV